MSAFVAESPHDVYIKIVLQKNMDAPPCEKSFDELVEVTYEHVSIKAVCYNSEDDVVTY